MNHPTLYDAWPDAEQHLRGQGFLRGDPLTQGLEQARAVQTRYLMHLAQHDVMLGACRDWLIDGPYGAVTVRIMQPLSQRSEVPIIYLRGGGWWVGNLDTSARTMALACSISGMPVVGIDYRLAPEYQFPVQLDEIVASVLWLADMGSRVGVRIDDGVLIWGESAGATLAVCAAREMRVFGIRCLGHLLHYGNFLGPYPHSRPVSRFAWSQYLGAGGSLPPARALAFAGAGVAGVERAWLCAGTADEMLIDTQLMERELGTAGIEYEAHYYDAMPHGFLALSGMLRPAAEAIESAASAACRFTQEALTQTDIRLLREPT